MTQAQKVLLYVLLSAIAIMLAAALVGYGNRAKANDAVANPQSNAGWNVCQNGVCTWGEGPLPNPNIRIVPPRNSDGGWDKQCDPKAVRDRYGVQRYVYSKPGCEFGTPEQQ